ncbi:hypothetical protein ADK59_21750 [Streptomyces sp. XY332]|nr:hypothetical protein ADK59_21750 [Streptomyces sp. XY332]
MSFTVGNTGDVTADEVAQLCSRAVEPPVPRPRRQLAAHRRVTLAVGEVTEVAFRVPMSAFAFWHVMRTLQSTAYEAGASTGVLIGTPGGRTLHSSLGWTMCSPMTSLWYEPSDAAR